MRMGEEQREREKQVSYWAGSLIRGLIPGATHEILVSRQSIIFGYRAMKIKILKEFQLSKMSILIFTPHSHLAFGCHFGNAFPRLSPSLEPLAGPGRMPDEGFPQTRE